LVFNKKNYDKNKIRGCSCGFICGKTFPADFLAHLPAKIDFLRIFLWVLLRIHLRIVCRKDATNFFSFSAENSAGKFPEDSKIRRKRLPTKVLAGNQNSQENPQVISKILVVYITRKLQI
jgi:hypothetical protein